MKQNCKYVKKIFFSSVFLLCFFITAFLYQPIKTAFSEILIDDIENYAFKKQIIIDAGHGGFDPGAIAINGANEKDINLQISLILRDLLKLNGYDVIMTRESDIALDEENCKGVLQRKTSDIKNRLSIMDKYEDTPVLLIHQNEFTEEKYSGAQMFFGCKNPQSKMLAQSIQESFVALLQPTNKRVIKKAPHSVYLPNHAKNPIVLVECGFISNSNEAELLTLKTYQQKVAFAIFCGIINIKEGTVI